MPRGARSGQQRMQTAMQTEPRGDADPHGSSIGAPRGRSSRRLDGGEESSGIADRSERLNALGSTLRMGDVRVVPNSGTEMRLELLSGWGKDSHTFSFRLYGG